MLTWAYSIGERNVSLRKNIVERILRIYHATCRNLTIVNDNLSRNQATIEVQQYKLKHLFQDTSHLSGHLFQDTSHLSGHLVGHFIPIRTFTFIRTSTLQFFCFFLLVESEFSPEES